ncbi:MAG: hypothetical protein OXH92_08885 [Bryobacterales bacterium]|nr:hypothetical protein [Bryobacterales bacterium]
MRTESGPLRKLPPSLGRIAEVAGRQGALALVERHGGAYLKVPRRYRAGHPLSLLLGAEAATKLIRRFGGMRLYIAKLDDPVRTRRNDEIIRSYEAGRSVAGLARQYGLSERRIWEILKTPG